MEHAVKSKTSWIVFFNNDNQIKTGTAELIHVPSALSIRFLLVKAEAQHQRGEA